VTQREQFDVALWLIQNGASEGYELLGQLIADALGEAAASLNRPESHGSSGIGFLRIVRVRHARHPGKLGEFPAGNGLGFPERSMVSTESGWRGLLGVT